MRPRLVERVSLNRGAFQTKKIDLFCQYVLAHDLAHYIKSLMLDLTFWSADPDLNDRFLSIFDAADTLRNVHVNVFRGPSEEALPIWHAVCAHPSFSTLRVDAWDDTRIPATVPLHTLHNLHIRVAMSASSQQICDLLCASAHTLRCLFMCSVSDLIIPELLDERHAVFPALRSIIIEQPVTAAQIVTAFPRLTHLKALCAIYTEPPAGCREAVVCPDLKHIKSTPLFLVPFLQNYPMPKSISEVDVLGPITCQDSLDELCQALSGYSVNALLLRLSIVPGSTVFEFGRTMITLGSLVSSLARTLPHLAVLSIQLLSNDDILSDDSQSVRRASLFYIKSYSNRMTFPVFRRRWLTHGL